MGVGSLQEVVTHGSGSIVQWNLDITKGQGTGKNLFAKTRFRYIVVPKFFIYFTITGVEKIVRYTKVFVIQRFITLRFHCTISMCNQMVTSEIRE